MTGYEDLVAELRMLRKEIAGIKQRRAQMLLSGTVAAVEGTKVKVRFADEDEDGEPLDSPWMRIANVTGKNGGGVSAFTRLGVGDQVLVVSVNGEVGPGSFVYPGPDTEDNPSPGTAEQDGQVWQVGQTTLRLKPDAIEFSVGEMNGEVRADLFRVRRGPGSAAPRVVIRPNYVKMRLKERWLIVTEDDIRQSEPLATLPDPDPTN